MAPFQFDKATWLLKCHVYRATVTSSSHSTARKLELGDTRDLSSPTETGDFEFVAQPGRGMGGNKPISPERWIDAADSIGHVARSIALFRESLSINDIWMYVLRNILCENKFRGKNETKELFATALTVFRFTSEIRARTRANFSPPHSLSRTRARAHARIIVLRNIDARRKLSRPKQEMMFLNWKYVSLYLRPPGTHTQPYFSAVIFSHEKPLLIVPT